MTVDATPPIIDHVRDAFSAATPSLGDDDADVVGATDLEIGCLFSARDAESGIREAKWCLGTFPGACDVIPTVLVEYRLLETQQSVGGLVDQVVYYSLITVLNNAGNWQARVSDGFTVDVSAPACGFVYDGPGYDRRFVGPTIAKANDVDGVNGTQTVGELVTSWVGFSDFVSGVGGYAASIVSGAMRDAGVTDDDLEPMGMAGSAPFIVALNHAETYYGAVRVPSRPRKPPSLPCPTSRIPLSETRLNFRCSPQVWDNLGNAQVCYSDGVLYDHTPPNVSRASLISHLSLTGETQVQRISHLIHAEVRTRAAYTLR